MIVQEDDPIDGEMYIRRNLLVKVVQMKEPFVVEGVNGSVYGRAGDYLVQSAKDLKSVVPAEKFDQNYRRYDPGEHVKADDLSDSGGSDAAEPVLAEDHVRVYEDNLNRGLLGSWELRRLIYAWRRQQEALTVLFSALESDALRECQHCKSFLASNLRDVKRMVGMGE